MDWMKCIPENCQFTIARGAQADVPIPLYWSGRGLVLHRELSRSRELQRRAERYLPGGVNSPVRAFRAVGGDPPFLVRAEGAYLWDADGNRYLDYFGSWGPMILGHAHPLVVEAIQRAAERSASFGASTAAEADLAELVISRHALDRKIALRQLGHGSDDVRDPRGAGVYQSKICDQV